MEAQRSLTPGGATRNPSSSRRCMQYDKGRCWLTPGAELEANQRERILAPMAAQWSPGDDKSCIASVDAPPLPCALDERLTRWGARDLRTEGFEARSRRERLQDYHRVGEPCVLRSVRMMRRAGPLPRSPLSFSDR